MGSIPANVGVFFGKVDKRPEGWYWADASKREEAANLPITGPFETQVQAADDAVKSAETVKSV